MRIFFYLPYVYNKMNPTSFVYKDRRDVRIEQLLTEKKSLYKKIEELSSSHSTIQKLKKQNELYRNKLNTILNQDGPILNNSSDNIGNKIKYLVGENKKLQTKIDEMKTEIDHAKRQKEAFETLKREREELTENVLVNKKVVYLSQKFEALQANIENCEKVKSIIEDNQDLRKKLKEIIEHRETKNSMQIEKLLNDRKRNISEVIRKQRRIERLLKFISENNLMSKLITY